MFRRLLAASYPVRPSPAPSAARCASAATPSFLARAAAANDASALLGEFRSTGCFDQVLAAAGLRITKIGPEGVECSLRVTPTLTNNYGTLHGGAISTIVDVAGTLALLGRDPTRPGVSVEMNQTFCSSAKEGDQLHVFGSVLKYGRSLGFTEVMIHLAAKEEEGARGRVIAVGRHTKLFPS
ncbi:hypothetical protein AB1Y20_004109 [Prymnesium parvum]|uniref:Acyl-coenzyme A thioesterase 13 n=1 Tax=Prymnesium parvum TaxID=97485 RepID=A0AB34J6Q3_PRYPA